MSEDTGWEQLLLLRGLTASTGVLHEAQVVQLRWWPRIAIPHAVSSEIRFDHAKRLVEFGVKLGKARPPKDLKARLDGLDRSVKSMLGDEYTVRVKVGTKTLFESRGARGKRRDGER